MFNLFDTGADAVYSMTRDSGRGFPAVVTLAGPTKTGPGGQKTRDDKTVNVRWVVKLDTNYARIISAEAVQQRVGEVMFVMWIRDVAKTLKDKLKTKDWIDYRGQRFDVVSSKVEDNAFIVTANELKEN